MPRNIYLGTMGFSYADWLGHFYPRGTKSSEYLRFYASRFDLVELDTTFHAAPDIARVERWAGQVPENFRFTVKVPRAITHDRRIDLGAADMADFLQTLRHIRNKIAAVLIQFPATFTLLNRPELSRFLDTLPSDFRFAIEFRHSSWFRTGTLTMLRDRNIGWAAAEYLGKPREIVQSADFAYIRLIGEHDRFPHNRHEQIDCTDRLFWWKEQIAALPETIRDVIVVMSNDYAGHSPTTLARLAGILDIRLKEIASAESEEDDSLFNF
jgi:uncharacterized protein YecE (DUF72 family)